MSDNLANSNDLPTLHNLAINATDDFVHTQPPQVLDLNNFSVMKDANDESDSELNSSLEKAITSQKHDLSNWSTLYRRTLLKMHKNPLDINYKMWQREAIQLQEIVRQMTAECTRLEAALSFGQPMATITTDPTAFSASAVRIDSKKLSLDSGTPRFDDNRHGKGQSFQVIRDPHLFLDGFKTYCENSYGEAPFLA
ncbi:hypothetical protein BGZ96_005466, partial [Linnemannia gamsii]